MNRHVVGLAVAALALFTSAAAADAAQEVREPPSSREVCGAGGCDALELGLLRAHALGPVGGSRETSEDRVGLFVAASLGAALGIVAGAYVGSRFNDDSDWLAEGFYGALVGSSVGAAAAARLASDEHSFGRRLLVTGGIALAGVGIAYAADSIDNNSPWVPAFIIAIPISQTFAMALW